MSKTIKKFTEKEIADWIYGHIIIDGHGKESEMFSEHNSVVKYLSKSVSDTEDGIVAVFARRNKYKHGEKK